MVDVAHALAQEPRFGGHCPFPYSVAQHSVLVSHRAEEVAKTFDWSVQIAREVAAVALLHDASEAYLKDLPRQLKALLPDYRVLEEEVQDAVLHRYGFFGRFAGDVDAKVGALVKSCDLELLAVEAEQLFPEAGRPERWRLERSPPAGYAILRMSFEEARAAFLARAEAVGLPTRE